ncbi:CoA transferase subunit A [Henriciella litoralis]|uniref:CoA transferase subunit A n=1 Tax=Henriciella litoralis TaxID=568102 RepID=UPI000A04E8A8|nr:CoA-transferase [Henriciella litoralis]
MSTLDKTASLAELAGEVRNGMTLGIAGWGARRKPMAFIRELLKTDVKDLTVVSYGGADVGMLASAGKIRKLIFAFVSLDAIPLEAHFRRARQAGEFEVMELDEGMFQDGLKAAAKRLPFMPTRAGIGTDIVRLSPQLKYIQSPYEDGETLIAMPALNLDLAVAHVNEADRQGNSWIAGPDPFFDEWFCRAAERSFLTAERIVETSAFDDPAKTVRMPIERSLVERVAEARFGAHPSSCSPDYGFDLAHLKAYSDATGEAWAGYRGEFVDGVDLDSYVEKVGGPDAISCLPMPVF